MLQILIAPANEDKGKWMDVYTEVIDWCISEERKRGFADKDGEKSIMGNYLAKRK